MWIVKLGGSLAGQAHLRPWLDQLARRAARPCLIVPGGGPFADAVRAAELIIGYDTLAAHRMAILAMQQMAMAFLSLQPALAALETMAEIQALAGSGVWLPWNLAGRDPSIRPSWDVTSDSLALWLAHRLGAPNLVLVKSAALPEGQADVGSLIDAGILDTAFAGLAATYQGHIDLLHADWRGSLVEPLPSACRVRA
ncbi:hypothetical protein SAMN07250955_107223 [Arboricoccus pini]|uniref:Aspartate/glutamate/uridylate kinase domain-containing protein n=1 Tax=Arboricoccus pini TaxID=1963835 RepID=A0A212RED3_9PROT|nr:hypothetical protein [Arboricoccus pini]SNB70529.1 hypothetical protein SAMN07250955_107223 [Arboricoccus pini]